MATPFVGEVKIVAFTFAPKGWSFCNGQFLPINQNQALFSILGTMYGGNGQTTFALPDLRGRTPIHMGSGFTEGQATGEQTHTVNLAEMPAHNHLANGSLTAANSIIATGGVPANAAFQAYSTTGGGLVPLVAGTVTMTGGSQPHANMQPYLVLNFAIALVGIFPSRN
jgi:microcystin-dependent protein